MFSLKAKIREKFGRKTKSLRKKGILPAVLYGAGIKNIPLQVDEKEFTRVFQEAGESSLVKLKIEGKKLKIQEPEVLIHDIQRDPLTGRIIHVDFYHPSSRKEVEAEIPLVFEGEAPAVKDLGGTLVREIQTVEVKGLAQNLPREIKVDVGKLKTFEDRVLIKDLKVPQGVKILRDPDEIVALVTLPEKEEEEVKPVEEEKVGEEKEGEEKGEEEKKAEAK
jgi:large subunit ribosomal protein L25